LVRGSSGVGKSAFLQYLLACIKNETKSVLVVGGTPENSSVRRFLQLSTNFLGLRTATITSFEEAINVEKHCERTLVDGCDWLPHSRNCTVGAASPSAPWKGFRRQNDLLQICMPPWPLDQLEQCLLLTQCTRQIDEISYQLVGGIA